MSIMAMTEMTNSATVIFSLPGSMVSEAASRLAFCSSVASAMGWLGRSFQPRMALIRKPMDRAKVTRANLNMLKSLVEKFADSRTVVARPNCRATLMGISGWLVAKPSGMSSLEVGNSSL